MNLPQAPLDALIQSITRRVPSPGDRPMPIPGLGFYRRERPQPPVVCMVEPCIVLVAQGEKQLWVGGQGYVYDPRRFLLTSLDIPANSEVLRASAERPCVGLTFKLDLRMLAELIAQGETPPTRERAALTGVGLSLIHI